MLLRFLPIVLASVSASIFWIGGVLGEEPQHQIGLNNYTLDFTLLNYNETFQNVPYNVSGMARKRASSSPYKAAHKAYSSFHEGLVPFVKSLKLKFNNKAPNSITTNVDILKEFVDPTDPIYFKTPALNLMMSEKYAIGGLANLLKYGSNLVKKSERKWFIKERSSLFKLIVTVNSTFKSLKAYALGSDGSDAAIGGINTAKYKITNNRLLSRFQILMKALKKISR